MTDTEIRDRIKTICRELSSNKINKDTERQLEAELASLCKEKARKNITRHGDHFIEIKQQPKQKE